MISVGHKMLPKRGSRKDCGDWEVHCRGWSHVWVRDGGWSHVCMRNGWCTSKDPVNGGYWITASPLKPLLSTKTQRKGDHCGGKDSWVEADPPARVAGYVGGCSVPSSSRILWLSGFSDSLTWSLKSISLNQCYHVQQLTLQRSTAVCAYLRGGMRCHLSMWLGRSPAWGPYLGRWPSGIRWAGCEG